MTAGSTEQRAEVEVGVRNDPFVLAARPPDVSVEAARHLVPDPPHDPPSGRLTQIYSLDIGITKVRRAVAGR